VKRSTHALVDLVAMTALLLSYIWLWKDAFPGDFFVCLALYLAIGFRSHASRGETARQIGFRLDNGRAALRQALLYVGPLIAGAVVVGLALGTTRIPDEPTSWLGVPRTFVWGTLQQYGLLAVYSRRLGEVLADGRAVILASAAAFAAFHLPNPFLVPVTLVAGALSVWLYRRVPNLWVLGLMHAVLSAAISHSLPHEVTYGMRVGPGFSWNGDVP
jgi:membrane protease YdiL (CAAX protease family)